jgi:hypothetical protein
MTATLTAPAVTVPQVSTLPDGDALGNDILASAGAANTAKLLKATAKGGATVKARKGTPPRISFQPSAWTLGGRVD